MAFTTDSKTSHYEQLQNKKQTLFLIHPMETGWNSNNSLPLCIKGH